MEKWIQLGALCHILGAVAHLSFWKVFHWKRELPALSPMNQGILQVLNLRMTFVFVFFALISYHFASELLLSLLGQSVLLGISLFWWFRAFEQILFFPQRQALTWVMFCGFCAIASLYLWPLIQLRSVGGLLLNF